MLTEIYYNAIINNAAAYLSVSLVKERGGKKTAQLSRYVKGKCNIILWNQ